jgi:formylglycine-generating enzyme required for sulfatase activity
VDPEIFITYSSKDQKVSRTICTALENRGLACWISSRNVKPGQNYQEQIVKAIRAAKIMVLVFTANANNSNEIKKELALASQNNLVVIPVRIEDVTPNEAFAYEFATRQWIDLFDDWENSIAHLVELIATAIDDHSSVDQARAISRGAQQEPAAARGGSDRPRQDAGAKRGEERARGNAADAPAPSNRALLAGSLIGAAVIAAIVAWFVVVRPTLVAVTPTPPTVTAQQVPSVPEPAPAPSAPTPPAVAPVQPAATPAPIVVTALSPEQERALRPTDTFKECSNCPEMVVVPAGTFTMGSPVSEQGALQSQVPQHKVTFANPFAVGEFALTFDEWDACVGGGGCNGYRPVDEGWGRGRHPVINVSWDDAKAYVAWLSKKTGKSYRLLSEAEREYVTRAGTTTPFWWGSSISTNQANYNGYSTYGNGVNGEYRARTVPVDSFAPNPWGLYQVHGNVYDWTEDCYHGGYKGAPDNGDAWTTDRTNGDCSFRVIRGGSLASDPEHLRAAGRDWVPAGDRENHVGFRVGRTLIP